MNCQCFCPQTDHRETTGSFFADSGKGTNPRLFNWISTLLLVFWVTLVMFVVQSGGGDQMEAPSQYEAKDLIEKLTR